MGKGGHGGKPWLLFKFRFSLILMVKERSLGVQHKCLCPTGMPRASKALSLFFMALGGDELGCCSETVLRDNI